MQASSCWPPPPYPPPLSPLPDTYPESRIEVDAARYPWSAVGRVNVDGRRFGTGVLIAPGLALTAAHTLRHPETGRLFPPEVVHFVAGYQRDKAPFHSRAIRIETHPLPPPGHALSPDLDIAVVKLERPLGRSVGHLGWMAFDRMALFSMGGRATDFTLSGYRKDRAHVQTRFTGCHLEGFIQGTELMLHACPVIQGDSGGPLIRFSRTGPHVVGIQVAALPPENGTPRNLVLSAGKAAPLLARLGIHPVPLVGMPALHGTPPLPPE